MNMAMALSDVVLVSRSAALEPAATADDEASAPLDDKDALAEAPALLALEATDEMEDLADSTAEERREEADPRALVAVGWALV